MYLANYYQLTYEQRCQIKVLLQVGLSIRRIATEIGVDASTVVREIKRNSGKRGYRSKQAHRKAMKRRDVRSKPYKLTDKIAKMIWQKLTKVQWSPEQISAYIEQTENIRISPKTIYSFIWNAKKNGGQLHIHLRHRKKRKPYGKASKRVIIKDRVPISERPPEVELKQRIGDYEVDTIIGKNHKGAIVSVVDRRSKLTLLAKVVKKTAFNVSSAIIRLLRDIREFVHTITSDNGTEFAKHKEIAKELNVHCFFAQPYSPWERGLNENTNGLVRQYIPKGSCLEHVTNDDILMIMHKLNHRPRKSLGFKTPAQLFFEETGVVIG